MISYNSLKSIAFAAVAVAAVLFVQGSSKPFSFQPDPSLSSTPAPSDNHGYVDMGLSVKWATCNLGASSISDYGDYYAWGETSPKTVYVWRTYRFTASGDSWENVKLSKYNTDYNRGTVDNKIILDLSDDAARAEWGYGWRIPTESEWSELVDNCTWTWIKLDGSNGYRVTSNLNGNSIFLPAAGESWDTYLRDAAGVNGSYWSSTLCYDDPMRAWNMNFGSTDVLLNRIGSRFSGFAIRPVLTDDELVPISQEDVSVENDTEDIYGFEMLSEKPKF